VTILEAIQKSTEYLARKGVESARLHSELLLGHVLKTPRLKLYLDFARALTEGETAALRELVQRRGAREPLQHILGSTSFCGLEIRVNRDVLVPRPETELLAEEGWKFLNAQGCEGTFVDVGAGSGCISIAVCHFASQARGVGLDLSKSALTMAAENAAQQGVAERLKLVESDLFGSLDPTMRFDLIISNLPYIPTCEIVTLQEEVQKHDPHLALDGGADGLDLYRRLAKEGLQHLEASGKLMVEFGDGQEGDLNQIFAAEGWEVEAVMKDYSDRPRILKASRASGA
jgi:release factor glutamine methyltransferase